MNIEIKFRGKSAETGEWVYGFYMKFNGVEKICSQLNPYVCREVVVVPDAVGQFTGLHDDGGNEIFDGDILGFTSPLMPFGAGRKYVVKYIKDGFYAVSTVKEGEEYGDYLHRKLRDERYSVEAYLPEHNGHITFGVIGNIHDNPNLLTIK
jgi:uncharacterized phage protein (TIGR01671 family)